MRFSLHCNTSALSAVKFLYNLRGTESCRSVLRKVSKKSERRQEGSAALCVVSYWLELYYLEEANSTSSE
jgi:hypothetical protein